MMTPMLAPITKPPRASDNWRRGNRPLRIECAAGESAASPTPTPTRLANKPAKLDANPAAAQLTDQTMIPMNITQRRENRSTAQPSGKAARVYINTNAKPSRSPTCTSLRLRSRRSGDTMSAMICRSTSDRTYMSSNTANAYQAPAAARAPLPASAVGAGVRSEMSRYLEPVPALCVDWRRLAPLAGKRAVDLIGAVVLIGDVVGKQPQVILPGVIRKSNSQVHDAEGILYSKRIMIQLIVDLRLIPIVAAHVHIERQPGKRNIVSRRDIHLPLGCIQARQPIDSLNERSPHSDVATLGKRLSRIAGRRQIGELAVQVSDT